jgi:hypothetical protein
LALAIGSGYAPGFVLARVQPSLAIHHVSVGAVGILPIDFGRLTGNVFVEPVFAVVAEDQKSLARPDWSFASWKAFRYWLDLQVREVLSSKYRCRQQE